MAVERITQDEGDKNKALRFPLFLDSSLTGTYTRVVPDEHKGGLFFAINTAPANYPQWSMPYVESRFEVSQPMAFILWGKTTDIDFAPDAFAEGFVKLLASWERPDMNLTVTSSTTELQSDVFRGLDYDFTDHRYLMHPFFGVRVEVRLSYFVNLC